MKMHFGQLQNQTGGLQKKEPAKAGVPAWVPPAHIIPLIDQQERDRQSRQKKKPPADQPRVEIDVDIQPGQEPEDREEDDRERGVMIIDLRA